MTTENPTRAVRLTDDELVLLDGRCSDEVQGQIVGAKLRLAARSELSHLTPSQASLVADIVAHAAEQGKLMFCYTEERTCRTCGRNDGYWPVRRTTKYKRKGKPDTDAPKLHSATDFRVTHVRIKDYCSLGCCDDCLKAIRADLVKRLENVRAELPEALTGHPPKFKAFDRRKCKKCGWTGHEGQMGRLQCWIGEGTYAGKCPTCGAESSLFNMAFEHVEGREVVEVAPVLLASGG